MHMTDDNILSKSIRYFKRVGPKRAEALNRLGVETLDDLLHFYPRRYEDRSHFTPIKDLAEGMTASIKGDVVVVSLKRFKKIVLVELAISDETGLTYATWFNQPFLKKQFKVGDKLVLYGKVEMYGKRLQLSNPEHEKVSARTSESVHTSRIVPVYPLTEGLAQKGVRRAVKELVSNFSAYVPDCLPEAIRLKYKLISKQIAIKHIHFPDSQESLESARKRLIFDEFFFFELALLSRVYKNRRIFRSFPMDHFEETFAEYKKSLPFELTDSQEEVIRNIGNELSKPFPMRRLLQGDVGSGKTAVAAFFFLLAARNGLQSALMVPTEVLADQHYSTLKTLLSPFHIRIALLTGSVQANEKKEVLADLRNNYRDLVVGTHSLIQEGIRFSNLGFVVIDEQHKFGVRQRSVLLSGDPKPHLLVMTATPIPRTLGLTLYGDLDVSTITELPKGRKPIKTFWITKTKNEEIMMQVCERVMKEDQAYMIFPTINETENSDLVPATKAFEEMKGGMFSEVPMGLVHGRMDKNARDYVMREFKDGKIRVLVATSVVEVGIDNPNATIMIIQHADRFGLSQLHQLRGRIGRGDKESFCFLFGDPSTEEGKKRLRIMTKTQDGFIISDEDLKLRGPGDFLGMRQSGIPYFKLADLFRDAAQLKIAREEATRLLDGDPEISAHPDLKVKIDLEANEFYATKTT